MLEKLWNFFMYGTLASDEDMYWDEDSWQGRRIAARKKAKENSNTENIDVTPEDKKAIYLAALSVFGPIIIVLIIVVLILVLITAKYF